MEGWLGVSRLGSSLGLVVRWLVPLAVACVRAFVRAFVRSLVRMHKYVGWDGDGGRVRVTMDGLRIWAEQVDRTRRADKPSLGGLRWFSSG